MIVDATTNHHPGAGGHQDTGSGKWISRSGSSRGETVTAAFPAVLTGGLPTDDHW